MKYRIGILGSGIVAKTLGTGFLKHGHDVMLGTRNVSKLDDWMLANNKGKVGSFEQAAEFGNILVLAAKGTIASEVLQLAKTKNLNGKTVMDATNPIAEQPPV